MGILEKLFGHGPRGTNGDDLLYGGARNDRIDGRKGDDQIFGLGGNDRLKGGKGDDLLDGGDGNDVLYGNAGNDVLLGGAGNDILYGDDKGHGHFGHFSFWWLCKPPGYADYLDGGAGNDRVYGGSGNDFASYAMAENLGARDFYDGGKGTDTLQLTLTYGEMALTSVQQDIARFEIFLDQRANPGRDNGKTFEFLSFDLDARNFEDLTVNLVNTAPTAGDDGGATDEDTVLNVPAAPGLLGNDTDPDHLDVLTVDLFDGSSAMGAVVTVNADGSYSYDPTAAAALQALKAGQSASDQFTYTIHDLAGATATATVTIEVAGRNDVPVAADDAYVLDEDTVLTMDFAAGVLANDSDADHDVLAAVMFEGPAHGMVSLATDGSFVYTPDTDYFGADSFQYRANDGQMPSGIATVNLTINAVNDAPVAGDDSATLDEDGTAIIAVLDNDLAGPANEAAQTLTITSAGALHGTVTINADGTLGYTPEADYNGADTISYTILDDGTTGGASDPKQAAATVSVSVNPVNDAPAANADSASTDEDTAISGNVLTAANGGQDTDVDGDTLVVTSVGTFASALGASVTLAADGTFGYDPAGAAALQALNAGQSKVDSFEYAISDGNGGTASATVDISVSGLGEPAAGKGQILDSVAPGTDLQYIVRFENGDWLELDGFTLGFQNSGAIGGGGGGGAGKSSADDATLLLGSGGQLAQLSGALLSGEHLKSVEIEAYRSSGEGKQLVDEFKFNDVLLSQLDSGSGGSNALSLDFKSFSHGHVEFDQKGGSGSKTVTGWDFFLQEEIGGPLPAADGSKAVLDEQVSPQDLDYYVLFDGADGWLKVDSFSLGLQNSGSTTIGGGGGAGKATATDVSLLLGSSAELLELTRALASGEHLKNVEIEAYAAGGSKGQGQIIDEFKFSDVLITQLDTANASANVLNFDFRSFTHGHVVVDQKDGTVEGFTGAGWDFATNQDVAAPNPHADVDLFA